jgi:hypothetical protein
MQVLGGVRLQFLEKECSVSRPGVLPVKARHNRHGLSAGVFLGL